jgi:hypothetical protein
VTVKRGGVDVVWPEQGSTVCVKYSQRGGDTLRLHVEVWDADIGLRDDLVGQAMVDLSEFVGRVAADALVACDLKESAVASSNGSSCGRLTLAVSCGVLAVTDAAKKVDNTVVRKLLEDTGSHAGACVCVCVCASCQVCVCSGWRGCGLHRCQASEGNFDRTRCGRPVRSFRVWSVCHNYLFHILPEI